MRTQRTPLRWQPARKTAVSAMASSPVRPCRSRFAWITQCVRSTCAGCRAAARGAGTCRRPRTRIVVEREARQFHQQQPARRPRVAPGRGLGRGRSCTTRFGEGRGVTSRTAITEELRQSLGREVRRPCPRSPQQLEITCPRPAPPCSQWPPRSRPAIDVVCTSPRGEHARHAGCPSPCPRARSS